MLCHDNLRRMRPEISFWPIQQFYDGKVVDGHNVCEESYGASVLSLQVQPALATAIILSAADGVPCSSGIHTHR